ncbi:hypothetical protein [Escherichia phage AV124]|nr:hypothetical protein [Escherichia phage AV124]
MNTLNKKIVHNLDFQVLLLGLGCCLIVNFEAQDGQDWNGYQYEIFCNRRIVEVYGHGEGGEREILISRDFTDDPLHITEEELSLVEVMMTHLSPFERSLHKLGCDLAVLHHNDASQEYAQGVVLTHLEKYLDAKKE